MRNLKVLDCTLRDGGLVNNFRFNDEYVREHIKILSKTNVDYIELGYKSDPELFDENDFGQLKFCIDEYVNSIIQGINKIPKLSFMVDVGRVNRNDIAKADKSPFSMARIACYLKNCMEAVNEILFLHDKGYETCLNIMAISKEDFGGIKEMLKKIKPQIPFTKVYVVDSYGALYPNQIKDLVNLYKSELYPMEIGIHAHNNLQLGFANSIMAIESGATFIDASVNGMGRGAGNCPIELMVSYLNNEKYNLKPILYLIEKYYKELKEKHKWGCSTEQLLSGIFNVHPVTGLKNVNYSFDEFNKNSNEKVG